MLVGEGLCEGEENKGEEQLPVVRWGAAPASYLGGGLVLCRHPRTVPFAFFFSLVAFLLVDFSSASVALGWACSDERRRHRGRGAALRRQ